jgi:hypothetical protein
MSLFSKIMKDEKFNLNILDRDEKPEYISSGVLTVNLMASGKITGGFPKGKISQIAAPSTLGKSFIGLSTLKNAQKMGMDCIIIDSEKAFDFNWATNIGGRRIEFLSDLIILAYSQAKDKENDEISGKLVSAKVKKGRGVVEHKVAKYRIKHDGGLDPFYGLLPFAEEGGYVIKPKNGRYAPAHIPDHPGVKLVDVYTKEFWLPILKETDFKDYLKNIFTFANHPIDIAKNDITEEINDEHINENQDSE